ncbi:MAG: hypothetical protein AAF937_05610 [Planctomycetota bacterium]
MLRRCIPTSTIAACLLSGSVAAAVVRTSPAHQGTAVPAEHQPEEQRTATVVLQDGQVITGELVEETEEQVVLLISGVRTTITTDRIRESYIQPPIEERYRRIRATIDEDDAEQLVQIAEWLMARSRPDLAIPDLEAALRADPFNERARELLRVATEARKLLEARDGDRQTPDEAEADRPASRPAPADVAKAFPLITDDDVNIMRVYEVDLDNPPRMVIERETMEAVFEAFAGQPGVPATQAGREALLQAPPSEQLELLFSLRAREFYNDVRVVNEPDALRRFRDDVYGTWLARGCASFRCHGGAEAGRLQLPRARKADPKVYLTAAIILESFRTAEGTPLLDFADPAQSVLLQAGLPRHLSSAPHPEVTGWRPVFRSEQDGRFREGIAWIDAMYTPRPTYPIDYTPLTSMEPSEQTQRSGR